MTIVEAAGALRAGRVTARQLTEDCLVAASTHNARTNAFIWLDVDRARAAADHVDRERASGVDRGLLHGIPISLKDLIDVAGQVTTAGSRVLGENLAVTDAIVVARLREAGAVLIGKTNLHEFALGTTSEDSAFGPVRNPHDTARLAGGSSGGSAAAVATGMGLASVGTDTGGSIRIPAAACGVVGLKPTRGDIPLDGVIPLSYSLDHVGPLARTVEDAAWLWTVLTGAPASPVTPVGAAGLRVGRLTGYFEAIVSADVRTAYESALASLVAAGVTVERIELDGIEDVARAYVNIVLPEAAHWHGRFLDTRRELYSPAVHARIASGRGINAVAYVDAQRTRRILRHVVTEALQGWDALALPTLPILAPPLGSADVPVPDGTDVVPIRAAMLRHTQLFNMTGHPAVSLPVPTSGLPVGLQLVGRWRQTERLLAIAAGCEKIIGTRPQAGE